MRSIVIALVFLSFLSLGHASGRQSPEATETIIDLKLIGTLFEVQMESRDSRPAAPKSPVTMREYSKRLSREIAKKVARRDGWGNEFMVVTFQEQLFVVSAGEDQIHDVIRALEEDELPPEGIESEDVLGDDILLGRYGNIINGPLTIGDRQKHTMADLRSIGTAIESFSIDNNVYPRQDRDLLPVELIGNLLSPVYIRTLPLVDAWGNEFLMWGTEGEYVIISLGADGAPDQYYGFSDGETKPFPFGGGFTDPDNDIIFANGQFVQWPEGTQQ